MTRSSWLIRVVLPRLGLALLGFGLATQGAMGQVPALAKHALTNAQIEAAIGEGRPWLDSIYRAHGLPGVQVAVSVGGHLVWSEGIGHANVESRTPVTPVSRFRVGSVAKPLTAVAIAQLVASGRLDIDAPVQTYVPNFPSKRWPITWDPSLQLHQADAAALRE